MNKYNDLLLYYEENKSKLHTDWLTFDGMLLKPSKQGLLGFFKKKDKFNIGSTVFYKKCNTNVKILEYDQVGNSYYIQIIGDNKIISTIEENLENLEKCVDEPKYVFKISQYINNLALHESVTMQGLKEISKYCPHFMKGFGVIKCNVEPKYRKATNPFEIKSKYPIEKDILLCEYIDNSSKFYNYIKSERIHENVLYSVVKQVLMAITIAQKEKQFTHYDLHSNNIMIKKCDKDLVFLYKIDDENQFCVPSLGYYSVIIDYGFSYISDMNDGPLLTSMAHTDVGFMSDRYDWVADPKLFLVTVSDEIKEKRNTKKAKKFRRIVKNIFAPLSIEWDSGWDNVVKKGAIDYVADLLKSYYIKSRLFEEYDYYCLDLLQSLIILPLEKQDYSNIKKSFETFLNEWVKIENEISNEFYNLYILKELIDSARIVRPDYMKSKTRERSLAIFRNSLYTILNKVSKFCIPKGIHFEKLLCFMFVLAKNIEGVLFEKIHKRVKLKKVEYDKMLLQSTEQIFATVNVNLQDSYVYNENTQILIIDNVLRRNDIYKLPTEEIDNINNINPLARGMYINDLYNLNISDRSF